jgi:hypothetical protein
MMRQIGGRISASFHLGMSGLSAHVVVRVQLTCGSGMSLTGLEALLQVCGYRLRLYGMMITSLFCSNFIKFRIFIDRDV